MTLFKECYRSLLKNNESIIFSCLLNAHLVEKKSYRGYIKYIFKNNIFGN